jgi:hypothetical protein
MINVGFARFSFAGMLVLQYFLSESLTEFCRRIDHATPKKEEESTTCQKA